MERALLVNIKLDSDKNDWPIGDSARELSELAQTSGCLVADSLICMRDKPTPNLFIGKGKAEEIAFLSSQLDINTVIFNRDLSGTQQRNLEEVIDLKTIDRTQLILDIFAAHARTPEGKIQVELAQLQYLMPRLVGKGIILSRLGGGIGTRGPGEQKLEVDRRHIRRRIEKLRQELKQVRSHRQTMRRKRKEKCIPSVALVGYTNAGKSTLLNSLTQAGQAVENGLFTTLDPLSKIFKLPNGENIVISDTVGFLHNLPHHLIESFKATLEEVTEADLLIHVLDASHPMVYEHHKSVMAILGQLKAENKSVITALNKIDLLEDKIWLNRLKEDFGASLAISAKFRQNEEKLLAEIERHLAARMQKAEIIIPYSRMDLMDLFYKEGRIESSKYISSGIKIKLTLPRIILERLKGIREVQFVN